MRNRWLRWPCDAHRNDGLVAIPAEVTTAFLDLDHRQAIAQTAVDTALALSLESVAVRDWESVRDACYSASAVYVQLNASMNESGQGASTSDIADVQRHIDDARRGVDAFYERHRRVLDGAAAAAAGVAAAADAALATAHQLRQRFAAADPVWTNYPSVRDAHDEFEARIRELRSARQRGDLAASRDAVRPVTDSASELRSALDNAPLRDEHAERALSSVRTRIDAVRTRTDAVAPQVSSLLREFHAGSSSDLIDNERLSRNAMVRARELVQQAVAAAAEHRPESALELIAQARAALSSAEELVDAVNDRLTLLRAIRDDPMKAERDARFRLRDAQWLAVDRGVVREWGTVLDAQVQRIDRAVAALAGPHPDYWRYHLDLQEISTFIGGIVARIRQRSAQ